MTEKMYIVRDSSAVQGAGERVHAINYEGSLIEVKFKFGEETILPESKALKFLLDGFTVIEADSGSIFKAPPAHVYGAPTALKEGEVLARYEELTLDALKVRCAMKPGGEIFLGDGVGRDELVSFLSDAPIPGAAVEELEENGDIEDEDDEDGTPAPLANDGFVDESAKTEVSDDPAVIPAEAIAEDDGTDSEDQEESVDAVDENTDFVGEEAASETDVPKEGQ